MSSILLYLRQLPLAEAEDQTGVELQPVDREIFSFPIFVESSRGHHV